MKRARGRYSGGTTNRGRAVMWAIAHDRGLTTSERCVLYVLETHVSYAERETGRCWPSWETIAECAGLGRSTVAGILAKLEALGWVEVVRRAVDGQQITSVYRVTPPRNDDRGDVPGVHPMDP